MELDVWICMRREREMFGCVCGERYRDRYVERDRDRYMERDVWMCMWREIGICMWRER